MMRVSAASKPSPRQISRRDQVRVYDLLRRIRSIKPEARRPDCVDAKQTRSTAARRVELAKSRKMSGSKITDPPLPRTPRLGTSAESDASTPRAPIGLLNSSCGNSRGLHLPSARSHLTNPSVYPLDRPCPALIRTPRSTVPSITATPRR